MTPYEAFRKYLRMKTNFEEYFTELRERGPSFHTTRVLGRVGPMTSIVFPDLVVTPDQLAAKQRESGPLDVPRP
eukprot:10690076-Prorocentrum_lima.AAC.1